MLKPIRDSAILALASVVMLLFLAEWNPARAQCELDQLLALDGQPGDVFGNSVAISGVVALVGAPRDDDNGADSGSAYVFGFNGSAWVQQAKLLPADGAAGDYFGCSVAVSGDVALVGAYRDDDNGTNSGSAYIFRFDGLQWIEEARLLPSDGATRDNFAISVALSGDTALIGARKDDDNGSNSGSAYVFRLDGLAWVEQPKLLPSDGQAGDQFGISVALHGDTAVIGAYWDDDSGGNSGSAYIFSVADSSWGEHTKLEPDDGAANDNFGGAVALFGNDIIVGAWKDNDNGVDSGSAYVFQHEGLRWSQQSKLLAGGGAGGDWFGHSVAIGNNVAVVGTKRDDDSGTNSGSAYVFRLVDSIWSQEFKLLPADGAPGDYCGTVALSDETAVVGVEYDDDSGEDSGSAYMFCVSQCTGDFDCNGDIELSDLGELLAHYGATSGVGCGEGDVDGDHDVDFDDLMWVLAHYNTTCP